MVPGAGRGAQSLRCLVARAGDRGGGDQRAGLGNGDAHRVRPSQTPPRCGEKATGWDVRSCVQACADMGGGCSRPKHSPRAPLIRPTTGGKRRTCCSISPARSRPTGYGSATSCICTSLMAIGPTCSPFRTCAPSTWRVIPGRAGRYGPICPRRGSRVPCSGRYWSNSPFYWIRPRA